MLRVLASKAPCLAVVAFVGAAAIGCRDVSSFTNDGDHFEGSVVAGSFVRAGVGDDVRMCLVLDAAHLQDAPGTLRSSDGLFVDTPLRPIPQLWHDPLSTLSFGEGRTKNLVYVATPHSVEGPETDAFIVLSLMQSGGVEVRVMRGAPSDTGASPSTANLFGVFTLDREKGPCSF